MTTYAPLFVEVITADRNPDGEPIKSQQINYNNPLSRRWLHEKHMPWALANGLTIHIAASIPINSHQSELIT